MKLIELEPRLLKIVADDRWSGDATMADCDGVQFLCPTCFETNKGSVGTHSVVCWKPHVPQTVYPRPGRWHILGTSFENLTLQAGSSSVKLNAPCNAHFFVRDGEVTPA